MKYTHIFDLFEKIICLALPVAAFGVSLYFVTSINVPVALGVI
jgi:hypothetical protein